MVVGEAHVIVRAITSGVSNDIKKAFKDIDGVGIDAGKEISRGLSRGMSSGGGGGFFSNLTQQASSARQTFDSLIITTYSLGPAIAGLVGAVSSLVGAFAALGATVAAAAPSLIVLPGLLAAIGVAAITLKLAFQGVGEAISAGLNQSSAGGAKAIAKDLTSYYRRIADAKEALRRTYEESDRLIEEAERRLSDAQQDYFQEELDRNEKLAEANAEYEKTIREGIESISDAQAKLQETEEKSARRVIDAKRKVSEAQEELTAAYAAGREEIQQLNFAAEDAVINEKRAALELEKAREKLRRSQDLPPNSRARKEAELAFAQADLNYRKAMDTNKDMATEQERLNKEGVDGTGAVSNAKKKLADAAQGQADAEVDAVRSVQEARLDLARTERDAAEDAAEARKRVSKADTESAEAMEQARIKIANAERNLETVIIKRLDAEYDAQLALQRAIEDLEKAKKKSDATGAAGSNAYQKAMEKLSKEQREFVKYMVGTFQPALDKFSGAAAKEFFPKLIPAMENLRTNLFPTLMPLFRETGSVLGDIATKISGTLTSPQFLSSLQNIWGNINKTILPGVGNIASNIIAGAASVLEAAQPLITKFVGWLDSVTGKFKDMFDTPGEIKKLETFFNRSGEIAAEIGGLIGDVLGGLGDIIGSQMGPESAGSSMLSFFREGAASFKAFTSSPEGIERISEFFNNTVANAKPILSFIGGLVKEFLKLGENPNIGLFFEKMNEYNIAGIIKEIADEFINAGPSIAEFTKNFLEFAKATLESGAISTFFDTLSIIFEKLTTFFQSPAMQAILPVIASIAAAGVALRLAWSLAKIPVLGILSPLLNLGKAFGKLSDKIGDAKQYKALGVQLGFVSRILALGVGPIALFVAAIAGLVAIFVAMWNESEIFRKAIKDLIDGVIQKAITIFETLKAKVEKALEPLGGMEGTVEKLKVAFKFLGDIIGTYVIPLLEGGLKNALDIIGAIFGTIIDTIGNFIAAFMRIFNGIKTGDVSEIFGGIVDAIFAPFKALVSNLVDLFKNIWNNVVEAVKTVLGIASPSQVFTDIANWIVDAIINVITFLPTKFIEHFTTMWTKAADFFTNTIGPALLGWPARITAFISGIWNGFLNHLKEKWREIETYLGSNGKIATFLKGLPARFVTWLKGVWQGILDDLTDIYNKVLDFFGEESDIGKFIKGLKETVSRWAKNIWGGLTSGLTTAVGVIKSALRPLASIINKLIDGANWVAEIAPGEPAFVIPNIPPFAKGGTVYPQPGGVIAQVAEAGRPERIEPLDPDGLSKRDKAMIEMLSGGGGKGTTINVYPSPGMDEVELASVISREISFMMRKGAI